MADRYLADYWRNPSLQRWSLSFYNQYLYESRIPSTPLLAWLGTVGHEPAQRSAKYLFLAHLKRALLFTWNTRDNGIPREEPAPWKLPDLTGPEIWAMWIRVFRVYLLYPLLLVFDVYTLLSSIIYRYLQSSTLQMDHIIVTDFSTRVMPTPTSLLARWIYGKKVALNALKVTFTDDEDNPPVDQYLGPLVKDWNVRD